MTYRAPVRDLGFALTAVAGMGRLPHAPDRDTLGAVLAGAADLAENVLAPLNRLGDKQGARYENGRVTLPAGFREAYQAYAQGGWGGLSAPERWGGQGLPTALAQAVLETVHAANMAFGLCPLLTLAAAEALQAHGDAQQQALYLPRLVSGEWTGTMNLTEPQAGTDLGAVRSRALPNGDGTYALHGSKIYITWGDHDLADNIVHLVLARLPEAPEGVRGISLFLAPKLLVNPDGSLGSPNHLRPAGIEHKLGINASPTCTMLFEGARAELVGQPNQGLAHMFTMMNAARLGVGVEGVGIAERAYQQALAYALERRQGRSSWSGEAGAPIFDHPDVRRTLSVMKARIEAARAICLLTAVEADLAGADERARRRYELLVPVAKAWSTDMGVEVASMGLQVHGGMGFVEETGAAQHYRDARIAPIYEGANGVQALDLVNRKLPAGEGAALRDLAEDMRDTAAELAAAHGLHDLAPPLSAGVAAMQQAAAWLLDRRGAPDALAGATPFLALLGDVTGGWLLAKGALAAAGSPDPYLAAKAPLARVYAHQVLSAAPAKVAAVCAGAQELYGLTPELLGAA
ncbi:MAG: acyl-CoA dehydrogenase [Proteobacteria bacterium]|nr:acyl-CoA dehydrogenase [Pseudomonadota bacterium]